MSPEEAGNIKMNQRHGVLKPYLDSLTEALIKKGETWEERSEINGRAGIAFPITCPV